VVTLHRGSRWKISVYGREHGIPHFHVEGPGFRCSVAIESMDVIVGTAPPRVLRTAREWAGRNRSALLAKWWELNG
jgi:hypothetical protein